MRLTKNDAQQRQTFRKFFFLVSHNWLGCHRISSYMVFRIESIINWMMMPFMTIYFKQKKKKKIRDICDKKKYLKIVSKFNWINIYKILFINGKRRKKNLNRKSTIKYTLLLNTRNKFIGNFQLKIDRFIKIAFVFN